MMDITTNNNAIPGDWKKAIVVLISNGEIDRLLEAIDRLAEHRWFATIGARYSRVSKTSLENNWMVI
jgi:hypothetical protein